MSDDKPGRRINTTRKNSSELTASGEIKTKLITIFGNPHRRLRGQVTQGRRFLAHFFDAVVKEVRRQQAKHEAKM